MAISSLGVLGCFNGKTVANEKAGAFEINNELLRRILQVLHNCKSKFWRSTTTTLSKRARQWAVILIGALAGVSTWLHQNSIVHNNDNSKKVVIWIAVTTARWYDIHFLLSSSGPNGLGPPSIKKQSWLVPCVKSKWALRNSKLPRLISESQSSWMKFLEQKWNFWTKS